MPCSRYSQDIYHERITRLRSLDGDGSRKVMNLRQVEVLDIIRVVRVQDLLCSEMHSVKVFTERDLWLPYLSSCPLGTFHTKHLTRFDGRKGRNERVPSVAEAAVTSRG